MTKREAIRECKRLWKEIEKSGRTKYEFLGSSAGKKWKAKDYWGNCPLCEYVDDSCAECPLKVQYGKTCTLLGFRDSGRSLPEWFETVRGLR